MKHLTTLIALCCALLPAAAAAQAPDEEELIARTTDTASPFYYTNLKMRYDAGDKTLTDTDYYYLYYGYAYQDAYKPLESNPDQEKMLMIAAGLDVEAPDPESVEAMLGFGRAALERDPFSPKVLNLMAFGYETLGDTETAERYAARMDGVIRAIVASGDGLTEKTPRHILMFDHALDVLSAEGLAHDRARIISRSVEFVPLAVPYVIEGKKRKGYYFDFSRVYRNKPEGYTYKRERTWQFNNLKPRVYK